MEQITERIEEEHDEQKLALEEREPETESEQEPECKGAHIRLGRRGEKAARDFLMRHGIDVIDMNWTCPAGEVDIVAWDGCTLRFVEVKTRKSTGRGFPEEAVTPEKRARYERIAEYYLQDFGKTEISVTFDIIGILVNGPDRAFLRYHRDAFGKDY